MHKPLYCVILAAGEGSRLVSEGVTVPKPLVEIAGQPMLQRLISIMAEAKPTAINMIYNEQMTEVDDFVKHASHPCPINTVRKTTESSLHSLVAATEGLPADCKVVATTVDTIFPKQEFLDYVAAVRDNDDYDAIMAVTDYIDDEKPLYVDTDENLMVTAFADTAAECRSPRYISGGVYALSPRAIEVARKCCAAGTKRMRNYQRQLLAEGLRVKAYPMSKILDVDHASDIVKANDFLRQQSVKNSENNGRD